MDVEISTGTTEKFIPHPILDDPVRMMRIIANPVYDKLTISRAAQIRKYSSFTHSRTSVRRDHSKERPVAGPLKSLHSDETMVMPIATNSHRSPSKSAFKHQNLPSISLLTGSATNRTTPRNSKSINRSRTGSLHSSFADNEKKSATEGNVRYTSTRHGFEVQHYSSPNWLTVDLLTKDACESEEKTFREMLDKKEQNEMTTRSIYTSQYYHQRFEDLLQSLRNGHLTHDEWARQNYQLHCLKTFYIQACEREQQRRNSYKQNIRRRRAQSVYKEWKEAKGEGHSGHRRSRLNTASSPPATEVNSVLSNLSSSVPNQATNRASVSSITESGSDDLPLLRSIKRVKHTKKVSEIPYILDEQRWSLDAMLKRVVGLAKPLPPAPTAVNRRQSSLTNLSHDNGVESGLRRDL